MPCTMGEGARQRGDLEYPRVGVGWEVERAVGRGLGNEGFTQAALHERQVADAYLAEAAPWWSSLGVSC